MLLPWNVPTRSAFLCFTEGVTTNVAERGSLGSAVCVDKGYGSRSKPVRSQGELHAVTIAMLPLSMAQRQLEAALHVFNSAQRRVSPSVWHLLHYQSSANTAKLDFCSHRRQSVVMGNGKSKEETVKEKAREWQRQIRGESRRIDRDISRMRQEEEKLKKEIKTMAEKGQAASVKTLARQVVRSRKAVARLERTKCSMSAVNLHLTTAVASMSTASALKMSSGVMKEMNRLMNVPELQRTMEDMRQEMMRAEIADEMMEEGFQESDDETEIDSAVARVYEELALDKSQLLDTGAAAASPAPVATPSPEATEDPLMQRLQALQR